MAREPRGQPIGHSSHKFFIVVQLVYQVTNLADSEVIRFQFSNASLPMTKQILASYPGLLTPAFVACSTNVGEGLVKLSHVV